MQYNALLGARRKRPARGESVLDRPCCFTCTKLRMKQGSRLARCTYLRAPVVERTVWGVDQCAGFDPRPPEDYAIPGSATKTAAGTKIIRPGDVSGRKKTRTRTVVIIVPPSEIALIVPPTPPTKVSDESGGTTGHGDVCHGGGRGHQRSPVADQSASQGIRDVTDEET